MFRNSAERFTVIATLLLCCYISVMECQSFTLSQPATGPSITCQGSDITLQCVILRNGVAVDPIWRRNGTVVDTNVLTIHQIVFNPTYNANTDLMITNVTLEDDNTEYECTAANSNITSSIVLNVTGIPTVKNLMATDNCLNVNASWTTITGGCSNSVQHMITLSSSSDTIEPVVTSDTSYTFNNTVMLTGDISVSIIAFIGNTMETSVQVAAQPSLLNIPQLTDPTMVERCVSYLYITWNDTTQCVPVSYTVMLTNTSSGVMLQSTSTDNNNYNFTGLTSDTSYTITITGRNRVGQNVVMNTTSSLISEVPPVVMGVTPSSITTGQQVEDIKISWMAPSILNLCTTSLISSYEVQIDYTNNDGRSTDIRSVPGNIVSVLMSDLFVGHPLPGTTYNIAVVAVNEGGRGVANTPICDCDCESSDDDDLSTGAAVAITLVVTFIITFVVTTLISVIITRMYDKRQLEKIVRTNNKKNNGTQDNSQFVRMGRDIKIDTNPSYAVMDKDTIKMDTNPSYAIMDKDTIKMDTNPAYTVTK
ncbi:mucin-17-like isoform X3 [Dysidea avara]|uniref:mucin-17-like isoform X3 n=1 Tax=Dysidea avara TaxID=196820 RepID=UPI00331B48A0